MAPSIEICPPEVFENIVERLSLAEIAGLRLCSRSLASLSTQETFKSFFASKQVTLSRAGLESFVRITSESPLACSVQKLTVAGIAVDSTLLEKELEEKARWETESNGPIFSSRKSKLTDEEVAKVESDLKAIKTVRDEQENMRQTTAVAELLSKAFQNIRVQGKHRRLPCLTTTVVVYHRDAETEKDPIEGGDWKVIWHAAANCFGSVMLALANSELPVDHLDVFNSTTRCSLGLGSMAAVLRSNGGVGDVLGSVTSLRISLSEQPANEKSSDDSEDKGVDEPRYETHPNDSDGILRLLGLCRNVQTLEVHWYSVPVWRVNREEHVRFDTLRCRTQQDIMLPRLETIILSGLDTKEGSLLRLLKSGPIKSVALSQFILIEGTFASVLNHCTSEEAGLEHFRFDDLYENRLVYFDGVGTSKFPILGHRRGGQTLERKGEKVRIPITYGFSGRPLGSPQAYRWHQIKRRDYGPP